MEPLPLEQYRPLERCSRKATASRSSNPALRRHCSRPPLSRSWSRRRWRTGMNF